MLTALQAEVVRGVDVNGSAAEIAHVLPVEREQALNNQERRGRDEMRLLGARVPGEVVNGNFNRISRRERPQLRKEEIVIERRRFVEVEPSSFFDREVIEVAIVRVERDDVRVEPLRDCLGRFRLARAGGAGDGDHVSFAHAFAILGITALSNCMNAPFTRSPVSNTS
jgi:hypothetical protein